MNNSPSSSNKNPQRVNKAQTARADTVGDIAVIGMACRFPGAGNVAEFWENLQKGQSSIEEVPADRWNRDEHYSTDKKAPNKSVSKWGGFIADADKFDAAFFGISPVEAAWMDPQQRIMLELAWTCMEAAWACTWAS
jgi:acyl transferase domain-containing protein